MQPAWSTQWWRTTHEWLSMRTIAFTPLMRMRIILSSPVLKEGDLWIGQEAEDREMREKVPMFAEVTEKTG